VDRQRPLLLSAGAILFVALLVLFLLTGPARAQSTAPRVGLSASLDSYVDRVDVLPGEIFTLYAGVYGPEVGGPLTDSLTDLIWVIHQVCCGAEIEILDVQYNPDFEHTGHPLLGVTSKASVCMAGDQLWLATVTARVNNEYPGDVLWAAGPFGPGKNCEGVQPVLNSLPVTIRMDADPTPEEGQSWGSVKAWYR